MLTQENTKIIARQTHHQKRNRWIMLGNTTNLIDKPATNLDEVYDVLETLLVWYPEVKDRLSDAERAIFSYVIEKAERILTNR